VRIPKKGESIEEELPPTPCPAVGCTGQLVKRRSRFGKTFIACSEFPECDVIGNEVETVLQKYEGRPKTAYAGKRKGKKPATKKPITKKTTSKKRKKPT